MRDSVRESLFNILGDALQDALIIDPFCGTGILVAEGLSGGAAAAIAMELDRHAFRQIKENLQSLDLLQHVELVAGDSFRGLGRLLETADRERDWVAVVCPPYEMFSSRIKDLNRMIRFIAEASPGGSIVVESDRSFDCQNLEPAGWEIRSYGITQLAIASLSSLRQLE